MSSSYGIFRIPVTICSNGEITSPYTEDDFTEVAFRGNSGFITWTVPFDVAEFALKDSVPVYPLDNGAQGIYTIGDIKKSIKKQLKGEKPRKVKVDRVLHSGFLVWLSLWPKDDSFVDSRGVKHEKNRHFTYNKDKCERKFVKLLAEVTEEQLWGALQAELTWRKNKSAQTGVNKLEFMSGPEPYLNQRKFEGWIGQTNETESDKQLVNPEDLY